MRCEFHGWKNRYTQSIALRAATLSFLVCAASLADAGTQAVSRTSDASIIPAEKTVITVRAGLSGDTDNDGIPDIIDIDDDNDTIPDDIEGTTDTDNDGIVDCLDNDSDNDGIPDLVEAFSSVGLINLVDRNRDGRLDDNVSVGENGLADVIELSSESGTTNTGNVDLDGDGLRDQHDLDSDNDGIPDVVEAGSSDNDFNGLYDFFLDLDSDGLADRLSMSPILVRDTDQDGISDFRDWDSDGDGLTDRLETAGEDADGDGQVDRFVDLNIDGLNDAYTETKMVLADTDRDGFPDYLDTDSDGDGVTDAEEAFSGTAGTPAIIPVSPFNPIPVEQPEQLTLETGESGSVFGCSVTARAKRVIDPVLLFMVLCSLLVFIRNACVATRLKKTLVKFAQARAWPAFFAAALISGCAMPTLPSAPALNPYVGLGLGASFLDANTADLPLEQDESYGTAGQLTVGLGLNKSLAVELRAADLGEATFTNGDAVGYQVADLTGMFKRQFNKITGFGRLGLGALFNDGDIETTQKNKTHLVVGLGADFALNQQLSLRAEWQGHDVDVMHTQLSVLYHFGRPQSAPPRVIAKSDVESDAPIQGDAPSQPVPKKPATRPEQATIAPPSQPVEPKVEPKVEPVQAPPAQPVPKPAVAKAPAELNKTAPANAVTQLEIDKITPPIKQSEPVEKLALAETKPVPVEQSNAAAPSSRAESSRLRPLITVPIPENNRVIPPDLDKDGIVDASDSCPDTRVGAPVFANGCAMFGDSVPGLNFFPDTDRLTNSAKDVLDTVANALTEKSDLRVTVAAHTSASNDPNAAMFLTRRRTIAIIRYLSEKGIEATRLKPEAYGDTQPLASAVEPNDNDRVELTLR